MSMMKQKIIIIFLCFALLITFCSCERLPEQKKYQASFLSLFDTVTVISGYAPDRETFSESVEQIQDKLSTYHQLYDIYNDYEGINNIKTINDQAGIAPVKVDQKIIDLIVFSKKMCNETDGMMNIALGSVLSLWHEARTYGIDNPEDAFLPDQSTLENAAYHTDINKVIVDTENSTVFLEDPQMRLDVGSVGKGYAVEQVALELEKEGFDHYVLSVGGNIRTIGTKENGEHWKIAVENPYEKETDTDYVETVYLSNMAVVTSGSYQRYYTVNGVRYHHIISPVTLYPENRYISVTVLSPDSGLADALSTALFNLSQDEGLHLLEAFPGTEAMWAYANGEVQHSEGFENYVENSKE